MTFDNAVLILAQCAFLEKGPTDSAMLTRPGIAVPCCV